MIVAQSFAKRSAAVFGLARSGLSSIRSLIAAGASVYAWDDKEALRDQAQQLGATVTPVGNWPWTSLEALILSPGVPFTHPAPHESVRLAQHAGVPVIGDMELFAREIRAGDMSAAPIIAVTGTNGKSTTTALIGHILSRCGFAAQIGGNIGKPVLDLSPPSRRTVYVLEVSSYQIDLAPGLSPDVAVLTNVTPDHIDRHGSFENYAAVKARLLQNTSKLGRVVIGVDDAQSASLFTRLMAADGAEAVPVSIGKVLGRGVFAVDAALYDAQGQRPVKVMDMAAATKLPGAHNWQNAALAYAATKRFVSDTRAIASAIADFPGLAHRIEDVGRIGKVRFINDSKATNAEAAERALLCFPEIYWIAGGRAKEGGIQSLRAHFPRIRKAFLIGEAADEFAGTLGEVPHDICGTLDVAMAHAFSEARNSPAPAPVVLLSPACASFDQFRDFEQRGEAFRAMVAGLATLERQAS